MDLLRKELERKKKALQAAKDNLSNNNDLSSNNNATTSTNEPTVGRRRFFKLSQLREQQEQQEEAERQRRQQEELIKQQQQLQQEQEELVRSNKRVTDGCSNNNNRNDSSETARWTKSKQQKNSIADNDEKDDGRIVVDPNNKKKNKKSDRKRRREESKDQGGINSENNNNIVNKQQSNKSSLSINNDVVIITTASESKVETENNNTTVLPLSSIEITQKLRNFGLPIRLFGEILDTIRYQRLQKALSEQKESLEHISEKDEYRLGHGHNIRNPFLERGNSETGISMNDQEPVITNNPNNEGNALTTGTTGIDADNLLLDPKDDSNTDDPHKRVYRYFKNLLKQWEADLSQRPDDVKRSVAGKKETNTVKQCKDYIRPLFKLCKNRTIEDSMLQHLLHIVTYCEQGEFVKAHDAYMDIAIGRAAWPIGVTMVGIHARTGRAKIESQNVAHVMNSELQRKYLTSVKRLMTYNQNKRTDVDPSKKVLN